jgi:hypothetical protein
MQRIRLTTNHTHATFQTSKEPTTPQKLPRERYSSLVSETSPSRTSMRRTLQNPNSSQRPSQANQVSTMRKHQTRWMSEDLRTNSTRSIVDDNEDDDLRSASNSNDTGGVRQTVRGGSMETTLGTRLVGGSLRAAGMSVKTGVADVFREPEESSSSSTIARRPGTGSIQEQQDSSSRESGPSRAAIFHDLRTPANAHHLERGAHTGPRSRPSTSMADFLPYNEDLPPPKTAPPGIRTYKSLYALDRDREGIGSRQSTSTPFSSTMAQERTYGSPRTRPREFPAQPLDEQAVEHLRLMDESLTMFEALLSRLPPMGDTTTATVPEVFRNAQAVVRFSEQVNGMLRAGTNRALERLIDSEVSDAGAEIDMVGLWKDVGGDYRDMLRVSDELVRTMTGFMLGVGKVLRESAAATGAANANANASNASLQHLRGASEDISRRSAAADSRSSTSGRGSGSADGFGGRRSTESRRSWDHHHLVRGGVERDKSDLLRRASSRVDVGALSGQRASSSMLLRERERTVEQDDGSSPSSQAQASASSRRLYTSGLQRESPASAKPNLATMESRDPPPRERTQDQEDGPAASTRRLYTPGLQRDMPASAKPDLVTIESQRSLHIEDGYEPSPTPAPRPRQSLDESSVRNKLPQLTVPPPPLPALPSETQQQTDKLARRKTLGAPLTVAAMRGGANPGMNITTPSAAPTTAITTLPVTRTDSGQSSTTSASASSSSAAATSSSKQNTNTVSFRRPLTVSVSALSGLSRHRQRPSTSEGPPKTPLSAITPLSASSSARSPWASSRSGSETERPPPAQMQSHSKFALGLGRRTIGAKSHLSLDAPTQQQAAGNGNGNGNGTAGGGGVQTLARASARERRRTITEIFSYP